MKRAIKTEEKSVKEANICQKNKHKNKKVRKIVVVDTETNLRRAWNHKKRAKNEEKRDMV